MEKEARKTEKGNTVRGDVAKFKYEYKAFDKSTLNRIAKGVSGQDVGSAAHALYKFWISLVPPDKIERFFTIDNDQDMFPIFLRAEFNGFMRAAAMNNYFEDAKKQGQVYAPTWFFEYAKKLKEEQEFNGFLVFILSYYSSQSGDPPNQEVMMKRFPWINDMVEDYLHVKRVLTERFNKIRIYHPQDVEDWAFLFVITNGNQRFWSLFLGEGYDVAYKQYNTYTTEVSGPLRQPLNRQRFNTMTTNNLFGTLAGFSDLATSNIGNLLP